jgi:hypothetical protein
LGTLALGHLGSWALWLLCTWALRQLDLEQFLKFGQYYQMWLYYDCSKQSLVKSSVFIFRIKIHFARFEQPKVWFMDLWLHFNIERSV